MKFTRLNTPHEVNELIEWHNTNSSYVVLDTETTHLDIHLADGVNIQLSGKTKDEAVLFDFIHVNYLAKLKTKIVAWNYKYDYKILQKYQVNIPLEQWIDPMLISHLIDENRDSDSLDSWVQELYKDSYKDAFWSKYDNYVDAPQDEQLDYACKDIIYTDRIYVHLMGEYNKQQLPLSLIEHVHQLSRVLVKTEQTGLNVDLNYLTTKGVELKSKIYRLLVDMKSSSQGYCEVVELDLYIKELEKRKTAKGKAGVIKPQFSFDSPSQLQSLLYTHLKLPVQKNEKTKQISTDSKSLEALQTLHPLIPHLQDYRECQKVYTSYIEGTADRMVSGRIYPSFNVNGTVTGRISHSNPNLGQMPRTGGIRGIYIPDDGYCFISADYSQLEVCIEANLTGDKNLRAIFEQGLSKHDITAKELGLDRNLAKTLNFALQYWCSHFKVAKILGVSPEEGLKVYNRYWDLYSGCKRLKQKTDAMVNSGTPIVTLFGRRRRFAAGKRPEWSGDYRQAYNFLIQSPGADITSKAFYLVNKALLAEGVGKALFTVHDEILITCPKQHTRRAEELLLQIMITVGREAKLEIPLKAESSGPMDRWED